MRELKGLLVRALIYLHFIFYLILYTVRFSSWTPSRFMMFHRETNILFGGLCGKDYFVVYLKECSVGLYHLKQSTKPSTTLLETNWCQYLFSMKKNRLFFELFVMITSPQIEQIVYCDMKWIIDCIFLIADPIKHALIYM